MRTTITKTVSMMLVTVMVLGVVAMPMRASAGLVNITPADVWGSIFNVTLDIAKQMLNPINNSPNTSAISRFSAFFESTLQEDLLYVTAEQMNELSYWFAQNGISVYPTSVPGRNLIALCVQNTSVFIPAIDTTIQLDVNVGDMYTYSGKTIVRIPGGSAAEEDRDSYTGNGSTSNNVGIGDDGQLVDVPTTDKDTGTTVGGGTFIHNETTNNWQVKNENGTYVDIEEFYYNPVTQTYHTTTNEYNSTTNTYDNRQYTYQFYYNYTYITYIGSSAEYREAYKVYFELPDGRSSGDLTADELKGISLQFDMVNYDKVASDTLTQILLPFDGDVDNVSYYDVSSSFLRSVGYSFLESPDPFGGYLYCPISNGSWANSFASYKSSYLPNNTSFTVQGRFYLDGVFSNNTVSTLDRRVGFYVVGYSNSSYWGGSTRIAVRLFDIYNGSLYIVNNTSNSVSVASGVWHDFCFTYDSSNQKISFFLDGINVISSWGSYNAFPEMPLSNFSNTSNPSWASESIPLYSIKVSGLGFYNGNYTCPLGVDNLRLVSAPLFSGVSGITVPQAPFDTNLVYVLPSVADLNDNTVAIMSQLPVSGYRVGGIRPTDPTLATGYIYMHIDGDFVDSVQQWNGSYWEEVTARLYTGIRWIPVTAFNVFTLEDMFDIIDPDADGSGPGVDSIFQYYLWWSGEWGTFQEWLKGTMQTLIEAIQASGGGGGSTDAPVVIVPGVNDQTTTSEITTENPDGSTTKTTIVSNAAGLVYSNSVTTYPTDVNGNTKTITVYTDSSGVMYQTETIIDKDGNVTVTEPTKATGTLGSILKMITGGVMEIAGTVIEGFVTIVVDGVKFIIESADSLIDGVGSMISSLASSITDFAGTVEDNLVQPGVDPSVDGDDDEQGDGDGGPTYNMFDVFFEVLPPEIVTALTLCFIAMIALPIINKMHF